GGLDSTHASGPFRGGDEGMDLVDAAADDVGEQRVVAAERHEVPHRTAPQQAVDDLGGAARHAVDAHDRLLGEAAGVGFDDDAQPGVVVVLEPGQAPAHRVL